MSATDWDTYAVCPCGARYRAPFGSLFHVHLEVCRKCGAPKRGWAIRTMRWVSTCHLFRPSTWGSGHWEERARCATAVAIVEGG